MKIFWSCLFLTFLFACSSEPKTKEKPVIPPLHEKNISIGEKLKTAINTDYLEILGIENESDRKYLKSLYEYNGMKPFWVNDSVENFISKRIDSVLAFPERIGLPREIIPIIETDNYLQKEFKISLALSYIYPYLKDGLIKFEEKTRIPFQQFSPDTLISYFNYNDSSSIFNQINQSVERDSNYAAILTGLNQFLDKHTLDTNTYSIRSIKYDTTAALKTTREALISKNYLSDTIKDSLLISKALQEFQLDNELKPDGVIGKFTAQELNESTKRKVQRILVGLDKYRNIKERPEKYIYINLPEYKLRYYAFDTLRSEHNIVIGKQENETPELTSKLRKIVVYPYWFVPYSISSKEILPSARRNSNYFEKHQYVVLDRNKDTIDPMKVNWKKIKTNAFPYRVIQQPGPKNSLGIIKFDFYNKHSVFFHDTPSKSLFGVDVRSYSHGCMRTKDPIELAKEILFRDSLKDELNPMQADSLDSLFGLDMNYEIKLLKPVPIFIEYHTVTTINGRLALFHDIYGRDEENIEILYGKE